VPVFNYILSKFNDRDRENLAAGAVEGATGLADLALQGGTYLYNKATGSNIDPYQIGTQASQALGLNPDRDSGLYTAGTIAGGALTGGAGAIRAAARAGAKEAGKAYGRSLAAETAGYAGGVAGAQAAEAAGMGETAQMVASMAGGVAGGSRIGNGPIINMADRSDRGAMGVGKSKNRVGTTGKYVGGPDWVDSPQALGRMRANYMDLVERGVQGADWYNDSSDFIDRVTPQRYQPQQIADTLAVTSQGTDVDANLGFTVKALNQRAVGDPVNTGRFPSNQSPLIERILDGEAPDLGPKRTPFASNLSVNWAPEFAIHPVHDIWDGRAYGYRKPDGKPWDGGFSPQQHAFMDEQASAIIGMLNEKRVGDRGDWDALKSQAAGWTGAQIAAGNIKPEDAAMHYGSFAPKYIANSTFEQTPGANTGQLEGIVDAPFAEREAFTNDSRSSWRNDRNQDRLYSSAGLLTDQSQTMVGAYTPASTGVLEINPGEVARPLVQMEDVNGSRAISPRDRGILDTVEGSRAYVDVQNAGAWHKIVPGAKAGEQTSLSVKMDASPSNEQMKALSEIASRNGMFAVDTGSGVNFINDPYSEIGAARTGATLGKEIKKGGIIDEIKGVVGETDIDRVKIDTGYIDYESAWQAGQGSGKATAQFLDSLNQSPTLRSNIEPELRRKAKMNMERDAEVAARTGRPIREDVQNARRIFIEGGLEALQRAVDRKDFVPAVALAAMLLPSAFSDQQNERSQTESL
jgi:hypothetical protein